MKPNFARILVTSVLFFTVATKALELTRRELAASSCIYTDSGEGDCGSDGCCDSLVECTQYGTCSLPSPVCAEGTCSGDQVCAAGAECVDPKAVHITPDKDPGSYVLAKIVYNSRDVNVVAGEGETYITEVSSYDEDLGCTIYIHWDTETGLPMYVYTEGSENDVIHFTFDDFGNFVDATLAGGRRQLTQSGERRLHSSDNGGVSVSCKDFCKQTIHTILVPGAQFCTKVTACDKQDIVCLVSKCVCDVIITLAAALVDEVCGASCVDDVDSDDGDSTNDPDPDEDTNTDDGDSTDDPDIDEDTNTDPDLGDDLSLTGDPHMIGLHGQRLDWSGVDGGWYVIMHDGPEKQLAVRVTAPFNAEFPDRQLITGFSLTTFGGHSLIIEAVDPYTTDTPGCSPDLAVPCLADGSLRITVDGAQSDSLLFPGEKIELPGDIVVSVANLPAECQPFGGDLEWAYIFSKMSHGRKLMSYAETSFLDFIKSWTKSTAAPPWCEKFLDEQGVQGLFMHASKHVVFKIDSDSFSLRLHHGTNHQGGEVIPDGRTLPELEFWQMDVHIERADVDTFTVTGILGETARPVLDSKTGDPIMTGPEAVNVDIEDLRLSGPLATDFAHLHKQSR